MPATSMLEEHVETLCSNPCGSLVIPARLESTRLSRKLLLRETGKTLLEHVIDRAQEALTLSGGLLSAVVVACDHSSLAEVAERCGTRGVITDVAHPNGTSRTAEAVQCLTSERQIDFAINLQADQPECCPRDIVRVAQMLTSDKAIDMATLAVPMNSDDSGLQRDPNVVKVAVDSEDRAICFTRSPAFLESLSLSDRHRVRWYRHLGVYGYTTQTLLEVARLPESPAEVTEQLEQLRPLNARKRIRVIIADNCNHPKPIDTADDYRAFVRRWRAQCGT